MLCAIQRTECELEKGRGRTTLDLEQPCDQETKIQPLPDLVVTATMPKRSKMKFESSDESPTQSVTASGGVTRSIKSRPGCQAAKSSIGVASQIPAVNSPLPHSATTRCAGCQREMPSLSVMHKQCEPALQVARRSASLPKTLDLGPNGVAYANTNDNNNQNAGAKVTKTGSQLSSSSNVYAHVPGPSAGEASGSSYGPPPSYESRVDFENASPSSDDVKRYSCDARTKALSALVILLTIITLSTLSVLVYFVVFGNKAETSNDIVGVNGTAGEQVNTTAGVNFTSTTATTAPTTVPGTDIQLNQTLYCGVFPAKYLPDGVVDVRSYTGTNLPFNPLQPVNDSRVRVSSRIVGAQPANVRQYPWQNQNEPVASNDVTTVGLRIVQSRVMGGEDAIVPWQVSLWLKGKGVTCGGSIIMRNWVLTAAHCTQANLDEASWTVYAGTSALSERNEAPAEKRGVVKIIQHEHYPDDMSYDYDISLMKLNAPYTFTEVIQPVCIPPHGHAFPVGMSCYVSGWGAVDSFGISSHPDILQHAQIDIISDTTCNSSEWLDGLITSRMLCAGKAQGMRDACQGDSGGPLSCYSTEKNVWMLAGSVSWGIDCGLPKLPGVYARMSFFTDWIWKNIGKAEGWIPQT